MMPKPNVDVLKKSLSAEDFALFERILVTRGANKGRVLASKPNVEYVSIPCDPEYPTSERTSPSKESGSAAYLWRMVAFAVSTNSQHHCMPMTADFDLPDAVLLGGPADPGHFKRWGRWSKLDEAGKIVYDVLPDPAAQAAGNERDKLKGALRAHLDKLSDIICATVPVSQHYGTLRWGRALGAL